MLDADPPDVVIPDLGLPIVSSHVVRQEIAAVQSCIASGGTTFTFS